MAQTLILDGLTLQVDASFKDDGEAPVYAMVGNQRTLMNPGQQGHPEVFRFEGQYFFKNGILCDKTEDVDWISEPYRTEALAFIASVQRQAQIAAKKGRGTVPKTLRVRLPRLQVQTRGQVLGGTKVKLTDVDPSTKREPVAAAE